MTGCGRSAPDGPSVQKAAAVGVVIEMLAFSRIGVPAISRSHPRLLSHLQSIVDLDAEVSDYALSLGVLKQQWTARRFYVRR